MSARFPLYPRCTMARRGDSVVGIDLGKRVFKAVALRRKNDGRFVLTSFAAHEVPEEFASPDELSTHLKALMKELGGSAKGCSIAVSDPNALIRIIEQPATPIGLLRNALRLNGLAVLNQECKDFVLDVAQVNTAPVAPVAGAANAEGGDGGIAVQAAVSTKTRYLVGGLLRDT